MPGTIDLASIQTAQLRFTLCLAHALLQGCSLEEQRHARRSMSSWLAEREQLMAEWGPYSLSGLVLTDDT